MGFYVVLLLSLGLLCCSPASHPPPLGPTAPTPPRLAIVHADVRFNHDQRGYITDAVAALNAQLPPLLFLLRFDGPRFADPDSGFDLYDIESTRPLVATVDEREGADVWGFTMASEHRAWLVSDRMKDAPDLYTHVVMHELLHAVGVVRHAPQSATNLMAPACSSTAAPLCLSMQDVRTICSQIGCMPAELRPCVIP